VTPNNGIDIQAAIGTPVRAVARGRVEYTSEDYGTYGQMIILNHGDGYFTLYGHLSEIDVSVGQEVEPGSDDRALGGFGLAQGADPPLRGAQGREPARSRALAALSGRGGHAVTRPVAGP
jgi:hypothetical protein